MPAKALSHLEINREVRRIMVAHWIDLGRISIHAVKTSVRVRGSLQKLPGTDTRLNAKQVEEIYRKVSRLPGVRNVFMEFDNWYQNELNNTWEPVGAKDSKTRRKDQTSNDAYDIT